MAVLSVIVIIFPAFLWLGGVLKLTRFSHFNLIESLGSLQNFYGHWQVYPVSKYI